MVRSLIAAKCSLLLKTRQTKAHWLQYSSSICRLYARCRTRKYTACCRSWRKSPQQSVWLAGVRSRRDWSTSLLAMTWSQHGSRRRWWGDSISTAPACSQNLAQFCQPLLKMAVGWTPHTHGRWMNTTHAWLLDEHHTRSLAHCRRRFGENSFEYIWVFWSFRVVLSILEFWSSFE